MFSSLPLQMYDTDDCNQHQPEVIMCRSNTCHPTLPLSHFAAPYQRLQKTIGSQAFLLEIHQIIITTNEMKANDKKGLSGSLVGVETFRYGVRTQRRNRNGPRVDRNGGKGLKEGRIGGCKNRQGDEGGGLCLPS